MNCVDDMIYDEDWDFVGWKHCWEKIILLCPLGGLPMSTIMLTAGRCPTFCLKAHQTCRGCIFVEDELMKVALWGFMDVLNIISTSRTLGKF